MTGHHSEAGQDAAREALLAVRAEIAKAVVGQDAVVSGLVIALLCRGHVLLEGVPGVAKTLLVRALAAAVQLDFKRVQFTPDLMPGDVTGSLVYDARTAAFTFREGPVFTNLLLADEINRTPPKTQAALLEAMAEGQVSIDGETNRLPVPFIVIATDNPIEFEGTYPLPEAQLDRFAVKIALKYLSAPEEAAMLRRRLDRRTAELEVDQVVDADRLLVMQDAVEQVTVHDDVINYVVAVAAATRSHPQVVVGASPRAELDLVQLARARALLNGRDYVLPEDVKALAVPAFGHRITLRPEMWVRSMNGADVVDQLLKRVPVPRAPGHS